MAVRVARIRRRAAAAGNDAPLIRAQRATPALATGVALFYVSLWASAYVPSKVGVLASSPMWFLVVRFAVAGSVALVFARASGARLPRTRRDWIAVALLGITGNAMYLGFTYEALRHLASGVAAIIASCNPLLLALVAPFALGERLTWRKGAGMVLGFGGVAWIMIARTGSGSAEPRDVALAFIGVCGSVASTIIYKKYCGGLDVRATTALQLLAAGIVLVPLAVVGEGRPHADFGPRLYCAFAYLVVVMSVGASQIWFWLLGRGEASRVSAFYFLTPVFGLAIAAMILGEPVGARDVGGLVAIAAGIVLVQRG